MPSVSEWNETEGKEQDCYKSYEVVFLALLYSTLTVLYLSATTTFQYLFLCCVTILLVLKQIK